jgi:hypothetical protein
MIKRVVAGILDDLGRILFVWLLLLLPVGWFLVPLHDIFFPVGGQTVGQAVVTEGREAVTFDSDFP